MDEGLSCQWWKKGCIVDDGERIVLWLVEKVLSYDWWRKGYIVNGGERFVVWGKGGGGKWLYSGRVVL